MIRKTASSLLRSESLRAAIWFAVGGAGFALGNILLARILSPQHFGIVSLVYALNQFGISFGPFGMEVVANRHRPRVDGRLLAISLSSSTITAMIIAAIAALYYGLSWSVAVLMLAMVIASSGNRICVSLFQGEHSLRAAMLLSQVHNYILLVAAAVVLCISIRSSVLVIAIGTCGYIITTVLGWWVASRTVNSDRKPVDFALSLREGLAALGFGAALQVLAQFERLVIPKVGSIEMLGTYAALAAVAGSPFRMIQTGVNFTLLPRLRVVTSMSEAKGVLLREVFVVGAMTAIATVAIVVISGPVFDTLLNGKYAINASLVAATIIVGIAKICAGFSTTVVSSIGSSRMLGTVSVFTVASLGVALLGAIAGAHYGLLGILYGVGIAWGVVCLGGCYMAVKSLRSRFGGPAA